MNEYMKLLQNELKRLVSKRVTVNIVDTNYIINIRGKQITVPLINNTTVRKNSIRNK